MITRAPKHARTWSRTVAKWTGLVLCLLLIVGWTISLRLGVGYVSDDSRREWTLLCGELTYGWRDRDWRRDADQYAPHAGWWKATWHGGPQSWAEWPPPIHFGRNRSASFVSVALWIPFLLVAIPTSVFWWVGRRETARAWRRFSEFARPLRRRRLGFLLYVACTVAHAIFFALAAVVAKQFGEFVRLDYRPPEPPLLYTLSQRVIGIGLIASPIAGLLWGILLVRLQNRLLLVQRDRCLACGYDLTGNVSGICPECGKPAPTESALPNQ